MTNRQLIKILLDEPMDAEVMLDFPKKHIDKNTGEVLGYMFEIAAVGRFGGITTIEFIDWRDKEEERMRLIDEVCHSIARQFSEHNEVVPFWLSIGDIRIKEVENDE